MKKSIILISSALLLIAGCAKEQLAEPAVQNEYDGPVTIVGATYEQYAPEGGTKASFDANGIFGWEDSDAALFELTGDSWANASAQDVTENKLYCTFSIIGTLSEDKVAVLPSDLSPERYDATSAKDGLKVTIPRYRTWVKDQSYATMIGFGNAQGNSYTFSHLCGLAKVTVNGVPSDATKFVFKTKGFKINGEFEAGKINTSGGQTISTAAASSTATETDDFEEDEETYSLTFASNDISSNGGVMEFNVPLPCGTYSNGFAFCFKNEYDNVIYKFAGSAEKVITRAKRIILPTINISGGSGEESKTIQNVPADHNGDFYLADAKNVLVNIPSGENAEKTINFKYYGTKPEKLEIKVVDEATPGTYKGTISGNLPETHVDFTTGTIANVEMTTSASTFEIAYPAVISTKLTVKGGNVKVRGAQVAEIEVAANAVASEETKAPVQIVVDKANTQQFTAPAVTAKANVIVAPAAGVEVKVTAEGQAKVANEGAGTVKDKDNNDITTKAAAQIDSIKYITLADAIAAVKDNETIELLANVTDAKGITVPSGKNFTVDFGGYTYTGLDNPAGSTGTTNQVFQLLQGSTITFKHGTINVAETNKTKFRFIIQNYANLTLENILLDGTNLAITDRDRYTISNNCGTVEFKGATTIKAAAERGVAFDVCKYQSYEAPTVTWNSTGTVAGKIELSGGEFILGHNLEVKQPIKVIAPAALDLKTYTLSGSSDFTKQKRGVVIVNRGGELTINGTTGVIDGSSNGVYAAVAMTEPETCDLTTNLSKEAKLTVQGGTLQGKYYGIVGNGERHNTEITVAGGTIKGVEENDCVGIYHPQSGTLTITGGNIEGSTGLVLKGGKLIVNGGKINGTGTAGTFSHNGSGWNNTGDALAIEACDYPGQNPPQANLSVTINGGQFTSTSGNAVASYAQNANHTALTGFIHGGTFSDESAIKYAAAGADITIAYQSNRDVSGIFIKANENKTITFDLGGKTLNFVGPAVGSTGTENQAFHIEKGNGTFTLKNGKVTIDNSVRTSYRFIIQNYNDLVVEDVELDGTNLAVSTNKVNYTVSNNSGKVEFNGATTIKAATTNGIAFDVCKSGSYAEPTVTWNSTGDVVGGIELTGGTFVVAKDLALTRPIRSNSNPAILTVNSDITISQKNSFPKVKTAKGNDFNENSSGVVIVNYGGNLTINGAGTIKASQSCYAAVSMTEKDEEYSNTDSKLTVDGTVTLQGDYFGIVGNGDRHNTDITVKGGTIKGVHENDNIGIFHPQNGKLTISGGDIQGFSSAVEVRAGTVAISAGSLKSTATTYECKANGSGSTTVGAALAIAQHNTKKPISVTLSGGTFEGLRAIALEDPQGNKDNEHVNVSISDGTYTATEYAIFNNYAGTTINISGGEFESTGANGIAVYARLGSVNITGGEFTNDSNSEATLHVGCPTAATDGLQPELTISGNDTMVKNNASGDYTYGGKPLVVNMANQLTYKAVEISGGKFYYRDPSKDDNVAEPNGNFLATGYAVSGNETTGWTVSATQN